MIVPVDIGLGVTIEIFYEGGQPAGLVETHPRPDDGTPCSGSLRFDGHAQMRSHPTWRVVSLEPLTLEPSILCRACGHHGFIRNGQWVPA